MKVVLISGKSASGKDQFAKYLYNYLDNKDYRVLIIHFADAVKFFAKEYFNWNGEKDEAGRTLLQKLGTDIVRKAYPTFWGEIVAKFISATEDSWDFVLIPDWRFINEGNIVKKFNKQTYTVRINRLNENGTYKLNPAFTKAQNEHISEIELDNYDFDYMVDNSGTLTDLTNNAAILAKEILCS